MFCISFNNQRLIEKIERHNFLLSFSNFAFLNFAFGFHTFHLKKVENNSIFNWGAEEISRGCLCFGMISFQQILGILMEVEQMEKDYEQMVSDLLNWLNSKIVELGRPFQKSMMAVQREMSTFKHFRTVEKPPK